jgi:hypothetical protein
MKEGEENKARHHTNGGAVPCRFDEFKRIPHSPAKVPWRLWPI